MNRRKTGGLLAVLLAVFCWLTGCSVIEPQGLMQPPRPTSDKQHIYAALREVVDSWNFTLKYPRTGEYRSAIILHDLTGDGEDEAIVFYQEDGGVITVVFLRRNGGGWEPFSTDRSSATQIDRVEFADLDGDGAPEVLIGWGNAVTSQSELNVYAYEAEPGEMKRMGGQETRPFFTYNELVLEDFDGDGSTEIFTASLGTAEVPANAKLFGISRDRKFEVYSSVDLDRDVSQYNHVSVGTLNGKVMGVLLDGTTSSAQVVTELVYWDESEQVLKAPFENDSGNQTSNPTARRAPVYSECVQGKLRFPILELMPGYPPDEEAASAYLTHWYSYEPSGGIQYEATEYLHLTDRYRLTLPQSWLGHVTIQADLEQHSITVYEWEQGLSDAGQTGSRKDALLRLWAISKSEWNALEHDGSVFLLLESGSTVYVASFPNPGNPLALTQEQMQQAIAPYEPGG